MASAILHVPGASCAILTPRVKEKMRELESGEVLEVRTDDPATREGMPAWSRMTGNPLLKVVEEDKHRTRFFIRKK
jgi:TusA-related sulfurtransferase